MLLAALFGAGGGLSLDLLNIAVSSELGYGAGGKCRRLGRRGVEIIVLAHRAVIILDIALRSTGRSLGFGLNERVLLARLLCQNGERYLIAYGIAEALVQSDKRTAIRNALILIAVIGGGDARELELLFRTYRIG